MITGSYTWGMTLTMCITTTISPGAVYKGHNFIRLKPFKYSLHHDP